MMAASAFNLSWVVLDAVLYKNEQWLMQSHKQHLHCNEILCSWSVYNRKCIPLGAVADGDRVQTRMPRSFYVQLPAEWGWKASCFRQPTCMGFWFSGVAASPGNAIESNTLCVPLVSRFASKSAVSDFRFRFCFCFFSLWPDSFFPSLIAWFRNSRRRHLISCFSLKQRSLQN